MSRPAEIERLYWRARFGALPGEVAPLARAGVAAAVRGLLTPRGADLRRGSPEPTAGGHPIDPVNALGHDVLWWLDRMVRGRHQLVERMTLNLHDHFATSNEKVMDASLMIGQYWTLRAHALGRFRELTQAIMVDPAMQRWLDLAGSDKASPNENFARELFELFTLGTNNGYTETDIREAARALTGYVFDPATKRIGFDPARHDAGDKTIFGRRGNFGPADVVNLAIDHPNHAPFICAKLWDYFIPRPCPPATLSALVATYRTSGTELRPVLASILRHPIMYSRLEAPEQVKPPAVYLAGMLRKSRIFVRFEDWPALLQQMGQLPFYPPNVNGWEQGEAWLSTSTIRARYQAASEVIRQMGIRDGSIAETQTVQRALASARLATGNPWTTPQTRSALTHFARTSVATKNARWQPEHYWPERQRVLRHLLLAGPDAQVC